jgi:hypothetical protein
MEYTGCWNGLFIVGGTVAVALVLSTVARRLFADSALRVGHDATGNLLAVVGTLYAVLLGLIVVEAMTRFDRAVDCVQNESNSLADIFLLCDHLAEPQGGRLKQLARTYARQVVDLEWPAMDRAGMSHDARLTALAMVRALDDFEPRSEAEKAVYPLVLEQLREMWDRRRERAGFAEFGIPAVEWATLLIGAAVTLFFAGLFHVEHLSLQLLISGLTALVIGLNLYLVVLFGYPFAGDLSVSNRPFQVDIAIFDGVYDSGLAHPGEDAGTPVGARPAQSP